MDGTAVQENLKPMELEAAKSLIFGKSTSVTQESVIPFTELELELIHALQANPRGSWTHIGSELGVDASTVSRRWRTLRSSERAWILGYSIDMAPVVAYLWVGCAARMIDEVGARLCLENSVYLVERVDGKHDYFLGVTAATVHALDRLIARIAAFPGVATVASHLCLRVVHDGSSWVPGILNNKAPARIAEILERGGPPPRRVTRTEQAILTALGSDGRASFSRLAELSGLTESTVRRHLHELVDTNRVRLRCDISQRAAGWPMSMVIVIEIDRGAVEFAHIVSQWSATRLISVTSGPARLTMLFWLRSATDGYLLQERLQQQGQTVQIVEAAIGLRSLKRMGRLFDPNGAATGFVPLGLYSGW